MRIHTDLKHTATHCNTVQHTIKGTATHCNTLQRTATHCNTLQQGILWHLFRRRSAQMVRLLCWLQEHARARASASSAREPALFFITAFQKKPYCVFYSVVIHERVCIYILTHMYIHAYTCTYVHPTLALYTTVTHLHTTNAYALYVPKSAICSHVMYSTATHCNIP